MIFFGVNSSNVGTEYDGIHMATHVKEICNKQPLLPTPPSLPSFLPLHASFVSFSSGPLYCR